MVEDKKQDAEESLKKKYAQLKAKKEAKQQQKVEEGERKVGAGAGGTTGALSGILQQMESKAQPDEGKQDDRESGSVVKASALDRSAIEAFKAARGPTYAEPPAKRHRSMGGSLPAIPRRAFGGASGGSSEREARGTDSPLSGGDGGAKSAGHGDKVDGFPRRVHEALQKVFVEGSLRRDEMEEKVLMALRCLPETDALKALEQFGNEDMSRIRNKAAYLWGIVRNLREGRNKTYQSGGLSARDDDSSSAPRGHVKLLWPEEEYVMQDLGAPQGRMLEREFCFDNSACSLPPVESLYMDEPYQNSELMRVRAELGHAKSETEGQDPVQWLKLTSQVSLTGRVVPNIRQTSRPELCSTSWVQFYELLSAYQLVSPVNNADEKLRSLHLCEMSGASVAALNHYLKVKHPNMTMDWLAHTRLELPVAPEGSGRTAVGGAKSDEERFMRETKSHWIFGADPSSHVIDATSIKTIQAKAAQGNSFALVLADSGVMSDAHMHAGASGASMLATPRDPARDQPESAAARCFLAQAVVGLSTLAPKGCMVLRLWALWEHQNVGLLFLLNCVFDEVKVCRPSTVQLAGEDCFAVCLGFKGLGAAYLEALHAEIARGSASVNTIKTMIAKSHLPSEWVSQLKSGALLFARLQASVIRREVRLFTAMSNAERHELRNARDAAAAHWRERFDCRALPSVHDRIVVEGIGGGSQYSMTTSGGGKQWFALRGRFSKGHQPQSLNTKA